MYSNAGNLSPHLGKISINLLANKMLERQIVQPSAAEKITHDGCLLIQRAFSRLQRIVFFDCFRTIHGSLETQDNIAKCLVFTKSTFKRILIVTKAIVMQFRRILELHLRQ